MHQRSIGLFPLTLLVATAACGGGRADGGWAGSVIVDSAGVIHVDNPAVGLWGRGGAPVPREVLRIGAEEGEAEYQFGEIGSIAVDGAGHIHVGDRLSREVRVYDAEGNFLRRIGRPGAGPGELGSGGTSVHLGPGDTLIIPDPGQHRINYFTTDGAFIRSRPLSPAEGISRGWSAVPGAGLLQQLRPFGPGLRESEQGADHLVLRSWSGEIIDTVLHLPGRGFRTDGGGRPASALFAPEPIWSSASDGRIFLALSSEYRIEARSLTGQLLMVIRKGVEPKPIGKADRELILGHLGERLERSGVPPAGLDQILRGIAIADHYPVLARFLEGPDGSLWVQGVQSARRVAASAGAIHLDEFGSPEWDVFDRDGRFLGEITLPPRFQPHQVLGSRVYGVVRDDLDLPYVMVLEVTGDFAPAAEGPGG